MNALRTRSFLSLLLAVAVCGFSACTENDSIDEAAAPSADPVAATATPAGSLDEAPAPAANPHQNFSPTDGALYDLETPSGTIDIEGHWVVFRRNSFNHGLEHKLYINGSGWTGWSSPFPNNTEITSKPSAVVDAHGTLFVFARHNSDLQFRFYDRSINQWTDWNSAHVGDIDSAPSAVVWNGGLFVFFKKSNRLEYTYYTENVGWTGVIVVTGPGEISSAPSATVDPYGYLTVFARQPDKTLGFRTYDPANPNNFNGWVGFSSVNPFYQVASAPAASHDFQKHLLVFSTSPEGAVVASAYHYDLGAWTGFFAVGAPGVVTSASTGVAVIQNGLWPAVVTHDIFHQLIISFQQANGSWGSFNII